MPDFIAPIISAASVLLATATGFVAAVRAFRRTPEDRAKAKADADKAKADAAIADASASGAYSALAREMAQQNSELRARIKALEEENDKLIEKLEALHRHCEANQTRMAGMEQELTALRAQVNAQGGGASVTAP